MGWRDFQPQAVEKKEKSTSNDLIPLIPHTPELDVSNPETKKTPSLDLLTEVELEAFNGWYSTMRKPEHGMSHEEATLMAWRFLMESMEIMRRDGRGRYSSEN